MSKVWKSTLVLLAALMLLMGALPLSVAAYEEWDGTGKTVTLKAGEEVTYIFTPAATGQYTVGKNSSVIRVDIQPEDTSDKDASPLYAGSWAVGGQEGESYTLKGGARYIVRLSMWGGHTEWPDGFTDTVWIRAGEPPREEDLCTEYPSSGALKLTVKPGETYRYKFTPSETARYVLYSANTVVSVRLFHDMDDLGVSDNQLMIANPFGTMYGYCATLTAGETYLIYFDMWEGHTDWPQGFTDTYYLKKVKAMTSAELRAADAPTVSNLYGYVGGSIHLFPYTDPLYYEAFTTKWTVSDSTVAKMLPGYGEGQNCELELLKAGTVTVTAMVDGTPVRQTLTVKDRPVLTLDKTITLSFGGSRGVECVFTPDQSGTYYFHMSGAGGTTGIKDTENYFFWEGKGTLSAYLTAGKTYILTSALGCSDYTVKVSRGSSNNLGGTSGVQSGGQNVGTTTAGLPSGDEPAPGTSVAQGEDVPVDTSTALPTGSDQPDHKVPVHQENGKGNVRYEDVAPLLGEGETLTVTVEDDTVTTVALPVEVLTEAAQAQTTLRLELPRATVALDAAALAHAAELAKGDAVELTVETIPQTDLTEQQQKQLKSKEVAGVVRILLDGGTEIHDLGGGTASVTVPFTPEEGKSLKDYTVYYVSDAGKLEKMKTLVSEGGLTFLTTHFSDYAVVKDPSEQPQGVKPLAVVLWTVGALLILGSGTVAALLLTKKRKPTRAE